MGIFSGFTDAFEDVLGFAFGWIKDALVPDVPKPEGGLKATYASPDAKFPVIYGTRGRVNGVIVFQETNEGSNDDIKNELLHLIIVWGEGQCKSIDQVYIEEDTIDSSRFYYNGNSNQRFAYARHFPNGMGNYSDPLLTAAGWRESDKLEGKCCSYIRCEYTQEEGVWGGFPKLSADIQGRMISTPSGGALTASSNPVDQLYDFLKSPIYGEGLPSSLIDVASFQAQRALPNTQVEEVIGSGNYRNLYTSNVILDTDKEVSENVDILLKSMRAALPRINGKRTLVIEQDSTPADFSLTEDGAGTSCRMIKLGKITENNKDATYDRVIVKYVDPEAEWELQEAIWPEVGSIYETEQFAASGVGDGLLPPNEHSVTLESCTNFYEAKHYAKMLYEIAKEGLRTQVIAEPEASILTPGDIIPVTHSFPGWEGKLFRVEKVSESMGTGLVSLTLREHQPYIYDFENTGEKPEILDTSLTFTNPAAPTSLTATPIYNSFAQVQLTWDGTTTNYEVAVYLSGTLILNEVIGRKSYDLKNLSIASYDFKVRAIGGLNRRSEWAEISVSITQPPTPQSDISIDNGNGVITVSPPTPDQIQAIYEGLFTTDSELDPNEDDHSLFRMAQGGKSITVPTPNHGVTYYVWYRIVTPEGTGTWYVREVVSSGIVIEQLAPSASGPIERAQIGGILDDLINRLDSRTSATQVDITQLAIDAIAAINEQTQVNFVSAEYVAEIQGFRNEVNEALGQVLVEGGAVTAEEFTFTRALVDTHQGQISTLIQQQSTTDGLIQAQATAIEQNADAIELLTVSLGETDFNQLSLRLNAAENTIVSTSYSVTNANINIIDQVFQNALDKADLIDTAATLALAQQSITTLTDETTAQAEILTSALTIAEEAQAGYQDNITSIAQETSARVAADNLLSAQIATETANRTAAVNTVNQAITDESNARASAIQAVQSAIDDEISNRTAAVGTVSQAISDETSARASADQTLQANIDSESTTRSSQIQTVSDAIVTESESRALLAQQLTATNDEVESQATRLTEVENQADGTQSAVDALLLTVGDVNDPTSVVRRLDQVETDSENNSSAISAVEVEVNNLDGDVATALLELQAVSDDVTSIKATARFGVDVNGNFTGIEVNGTPVSSEIKFNGQQFSLFDPVLGANALFYSSGKWNFKGSITASEIFGSKFATATGTLARTEVHDDGTYLFWSGTGAKNDSNATFFIKKNGDGFVKGEFFQGQLTRRKFGESNTSSATATGHLSAGKPVRITCLCHFTKFTIDQTGRSSPRALNWEIKRGATVIKSGTVRVPFSQEQELADFNVTEFIQFNAITEDTGTTDGQTYNYTFSVTNVTGANYSLSIATDENLIG